jgi:hypothetical protein
LRYSLHPHIITVNPATRALQAIKYSCLFSHKCFHPGALDFIELSIERTKHGGIEQSLDKIAHFSLSKFIQLIASGLSSDRLNSR